MSKNPLIYLVILFNLIQLLLVEITHQAPPTIKPTTRHLHTATLIDNKLYIISGYDIAAGPATGIGGDQFFYLDVSTPFNTQTLQWDDLTNYNPNPSHFGAAAAKGGSNNDTLILYGGTDNTTSVFTFDTQNDSWGTPAINGETFDMRRSLTAVIDNRGKIYLFGGRLLVLESFTNDMFILDSINFNFAKGSSSNPPSPRALYGATLLPNQNIIYIGGSDNISESLPLDEVYLYDTINDQWSTQNATGLIPSSRKGLSAVLGLDGQQVIIFGGIGAPISPQEALYTLNINTFEWQIPNISGPIPNSRYFHKSNVIGNYMVVTFGSGYNQSESDVLLLDISNNDEFKWTTDFVPIQTVSPSPAPNTDKVLIGIIAGSIGGILLLSTGLFFLFRWNKNRKVQVGVVRSLDDYKVNNQSEKGGAVVVNVEENKENKVDNHDQETEQV